MLHCTNVKRLAVKLAVYVRAVIVLDKYYTSGLNLSCINIPINIITLFTVPFWGSLTGKDEYSRLCHSVLTGSGGRTASKGRFTHIACRAHAAPLPFPCHAVR